MGTGTTYASRQSCERRLVTAIAVAAMVTSLWSSCGWASPFGINTHIPADALLDEVTGAGIAWVRIDFLWRSVEAEENVLDWSTYDRLVAGIEARNLRVFATISGIPSWATAGAQGRGVPRNPDDWRDFCYRAAARYRGRITAWGMWNEPNLETYWQGTRAEYIDLILIAGAEAVHAADPQALVCGPELAHVGSSWDNWLEDVLARASPVLDVVTHHVYPDDRLHLDITDKLVRGGSNPWDPPSLREVLIDSGWWGRPVWITEIGLQSGYQGERTQASFYHSVLMDWFGVNREQSWVDRFFFYQLRDGASGSTWGIISAPPESWHKEAYDEYASFIADSSVDDAELIARTLPASVAPYTTFAASLTLANTGTSTWTVGDYRLSLSSNADWRVNEGDLLIDREIPPGTTITFHPVMTSPGIAGSPFVAAAHTLSWRMARDDQGSFGTPFATRIWISESEPVRITAQPQSAAVGLGDTAVFTVEAGTVSSLFFRWFRNSIELTEGDRFRGVLSPTLTVRDVSSDVTGEYYCLVSNVSGGYLTTRPAALAISPRPRSPGTRRLPAPVSVSARWHAGV